MAAPSTKRRKTPRKTARGTKAVAAPTRTGSATRAKPKRKPKPDAKPATAVKRRAGPAPGAKPRARSAGATTQKAKPATPPRPKAQPANPRTPRRAAPSHDAPTLPPPLASHPELGPLLRAVLSADAHERVRGLNLLRHLDTAALDDDTAVALLGAAVELPAAASALRESPAAELVQRFWDHPRAALIAPARAAYAHRGREVQLALLTLLATIGTRAAAEALVACLREHPWPAPMYPRFFWELPRLVRHADVLFPALLEGAGEYFVDVGNVLLIALRDGALAPATLAPQTPALLARLHDALERARRFQQPEDGAWRFAAKYAPVRAEAGMLLDLAGFLPGVTPEALLREALARTDPWFGLFAAVSLLRRGAAVDDAALHAVAACHETRTVLFELLQAQGALARFPAAFRTREAFAAADMSAWLAHPSELGREPAALERMAVFRAEPAEGDDAREMYVWRFREKPGGPWRAGVSGPYAVVDPPRPMHGEDTFSKFEPWDAATPAEHAASVLSTLEEWREDFARRDERSRTDASG